jgi:hypothetical protein
MSGIEPSHGKIQICFQLTEFPFGRLQLALACRNTCRCAQGDSIIARPSLGEVAVAPLFPHRCVCKARPASGGPCGTSDSWRVRSFPCVPSRTTCETRYCSSWFWRSSLDPDGLRCRLGRRDVNAVRLVPCLNRKRKDSTWL